MLLLLVSMPSTTHCKLGACYQQQITLNTVPATLIFADSGIKRAYMQESTLVESSLLSKQCCACYVEPTAHSHSYLATD